MWQPRARYEFRTVMEGMSRDEREILVRSQSVLRRRQEVSQLLREGIAGKKYEKVSRRAYDTVNVDGNRNVITACRRLGVPKLVFTSTMDVVVHGARPWFTETNRSPIRPPLQRTIIRARKSWQRK